MQQRDDDKAVQELPAGPTEAAHPGGRLVRRCLAAFQLLTEACISYPCASSSAVKGRGPREASHGPRQG